jgi:Rha family phage regulatory protein
MADHANSELSPVFEGAQPAVFAKDGAAFTNSRNVAAAFGKRHDDVLRAVKNLNCSREFNDRNFAAVEYSDAKGEGRPSIDMTRDGFSFVAMGFTGAKAGQFKERYIEAFNRMEAELRAPSANPMQLLNDPAALRGLLSGYADKVVALEGEVEEMRPKAQALERIALSKGALCVTDAAKTLQVARGALFAFLRSNGWIYPRGPGVQVAYQDKLDDGLLEQKMTTLRLSDGTERVETQVRVTAKGMTALAREAKSIGRPAKRWRK